MDLKQPSISYPKSEERVRDSLILYIDILGFKEFVINMNEKQEIQLEQCFRRIKTSEGPKYHNDVTGEYKPNFLCFSDTIIATIPFEKQMLSRDLRTMIHYACSIQEFVLCSLNLLVRGVLHLGKIAHYDGIIYGEGLIKAYCFESKIVSYPIIQISKEAYDNCDYAIKQLPGFVDANPAHINFLDHLKIANPCELTEIRRIIISKLEELKNCKARRKWIWFARLFNNILGSDVQIKTIPIPLF